MEFRDLGEKRSIQRPSIDYDDLDPYTGPVKGELSLSMVYIDSTDATGATAEGRISRSVLDRVRLTGTGLSSFDWDDTALKCADLSNARWSGIRLSRAELTGCRGIGWQLAASEAGDVYAEDCRFDMATINVEKVRGVVAFVRCSFKEATFAGRMDKMVFRDCDLSGAEFAASSAKGCDLRSSKLDGATGLLSLRGAIIDDTQTMEVAEQLAKEAGLTVNP
ncbi:pentapeptide repeat-containing protein [Streptomyces gamaensis]|uniref:Pentapeptide repeat-containing protein n=1 Tax=Streptomyces gamaensis TaxID=1763542 RepID=A0ABW0YT08_9ACTN